jgi:hypothetical protein
MISKSIFDSDCRQIKELTLNSFEPFSPFAQDSREEKQIGRVEFHLRWKEQFRLVRKKSLQLADSTQFESLAAQH